MKMQSKLDVNFLSARSVYKPVEADNIWPVSCMHWQH